MGPICTHNSRGQIHSLTVDYYLSKYSSSVWCQCSLGFFFFLLFPIKLEPHRSQIPNIKYVIFRSGVASNRSLGSTSIALFHLYKCGNIQSYEYLGRISTIFFFSFFGLELNTTQAMIAGWRCWLTSYSVLYWSNISSQIFCEILCWWIITANSRCVDSCSGRIVQCFGGLYR